MIKCDRKTRIIPYQWDGKTSVSSQTSSPFPMARIHFQLFPQRASQIPSQHFPHCPIPLTFPLHWDHHQLFLSYRTDASFCQVL